MTSVYTNLPKNKTIDCKECNGLGCELCNKTGRVLIPMPLGDRITHVENFLGNNYGMTANVGKR